MYELVLSYKCIYIAALQKKLQRKVYGQHLVKKVVINHLNAHMMNRPSKALTLSFNGGTGTGKNYVSKIIAESIYKNGMRSQYVHFISATVEYPHKYFVHVYKVNLKSHQSEISYVFQVFLSNLILCKILKKTSFRLHKHTFKIYIGILCVATFRRIENRGSFHDVQNITLC